MDFYWGCHFVLPVWVSLRCILIYKVKFTTQFDFFSFLVFPNDCNALCIQLHRNCLFVFFGCELGYSTIQHDIAAFDLVASCFLRGSRSFGGLLYSFTFSFFGGMNSGFVLVFLVSCEICGFWTHIQKRISFELFIVLVQWSLCCFFLWCSIQIYMGLDLMMVHIEFFV